MMNFAAFALSTLALLQAAAGESTIDGHAAVHKDAVPAVKQAFLFEDIFLGEDRTDDFKDCKKKCIDKKCKSAKSGDNTCKTDCKKKCESKDDDSGSKDDSKDRDGSGDSGSGSDDESDQFKQCKKACKVDNCKGSSISSGDELDRCKDACKDGCSSNDNYSDFSSSFTFNSGDVFASGDAVPVAKQAFLFEDIFLGEDRTDEFKDCKKKCIDKKCKSAKSGDNTCKTECKKKCESKDDDSDSKDRDGGDSGDSGSGSSDDSDQFKQCKKACKVDNCKGSSISSGDELDRCKDACKDGCSSNDNYSDFSSSFTFNSGDVFASADGDAGLQALAAARRNLRQRQV